MKIEGIYTPFLPTDNFATSGRWTPGQVQALTGTVTEKATTKLAAVISNLETARLGFAAKAKNPGSDEYNAAYANLQAANQAYIL